MAMLMTATLSVGLLAGCGTDNAKEETQNTEEGYGAYSAILKGDYHLIYTWETGQKRLYNVREDIGEQNDLSKVYPEIVNELSKELGNYLRQANAQRPVIKVTQKVCA